MRTPHTIGDLVRHLRREAGLTLGDVARVCGVSAACISALERYERKAIMKCESPPLTEDDINRILDTDRGLHPYGRCRCAGENDCGYCRGKCERCEGSGQTEHLRRGYTDVYACDDCSGTGRKDADGDWDKAEEDRHDQGRHMREQAYRKRL